MLNERSVCEVIWCAVLNGLDCRLTILHAEEMDSEAARILSFLSILFKVTEELSKGIDILTFVNIYNENSCFKERICAAFICPSHLSNAF